MLAFEGPDRCGKTQIAAEISARWTYPCYKNSGEWSTDLRTPEYFKNLLVYGGTFLTDFLCQVKPNVLLDRFYPSEWVYSRVFRRDTEEKIIKTIDEKFASAGGKIVLCRRKSYEGIRDDLHDYVDQALLKELDREYESFLGWTNCKVLSLWVDDENLEREVKEIEAWVL